MAELCRYCLRPIDERQVVEQDHSCNACWTGPPITTPEAIRRWRHADDEAEQ